MKKISSIFLALFLLVACVGCGKVTIDPATVTKDALANVKFESSLAKVNDQLKETFIGKEDGVSFDLYQGSSANADCFALFEVTDSSKLDKAKSMVDERIKSLKETYASYAPNEVKKIDNAVVVENGNYIAFCITADYENAGKLLKEYLKVK